MRSAILDNTHLERGRRIQVRQEPAAGVSAIPSF